MRSALGDLDDAEVVASDCHDCYSVALMAQLIEDLELIKMHV